LNEAQRLKEKAEAEARQESREAELKARKHPDEKLYELTLKDIDLPGLRPLVKGKPADAAGGVATPGAGAGQLASVGGKPPPAMTDGHTGDSTTTVNDADDPDKVPSVDADLDETERILSDYITLLLKEATLSVNP
jgi:hypothetical protein